MADIADSQRWPALAKDDEGLINEVFERLTASQLGTPYGEAGGAFAARLSELPVGLRAMGATHWLDISLTLDSLTWHFGNFGDPLLVALTEAGLWELGLDELAQRFAEAKELMVPLLSQRSEGDGDPYEILEKAGLQARGEELDRRASELGKREPNQSEIYRSWTRYARLHPERVFESSNAL